MDTTGVGGIDSHEPEPERTVPSLPGLLADGLRRTLGGRSSLPIEDSGFPARTFVAPSYDLGTLPGKDLGRQTGKLANGGR